MAKVPCMCGFQSDESGRVGRGCCQLVPGLVPGLGMKIWRVFIFLQAASRAGMFFALRMGI